jgi:predicted kinase
MQQRKSQNIILLRGLPGSGKTTFADLLSENGKYPVYSVDHYFTDEAGNYKFNHLENHLAYDECIRNTITAVQSGIEKIIVDNTFTIEWEMEPYFKIASENGCRIFVLTVENRHGSTNVHGISEEQIRKMEEKYKVVLH